MANPADEDDDRINDDSVEPGDVVAHQSDTGGPGGEVTRAYQQAANGDSRPDLLIFCEPSYLSEDVTMPARLGKYQMLGTIGRGGMGIVWKALDPDLQRTVAIKILSPHLAQSPVARRRFQREARAAAAISHPNVLTIHSVEEENGTPFLVMEFVSGNSLREYVQEKKRLDHFEVIRLGTQIALGLAAAHAGGVIHRDVKPANVMLHEGATRVRLMDFGLARVAFDNADLTSQDNTVGTPAYMAPEQVRGSRIDARADLFSLGCVLYYMAAGYSPFHGKSQAETIHKILDLNPPPLSKLIPGTPPVLSELIDKLLTKDPEQRYQSSLEVADILRRLQVQLNQSPTDELLDVLITKPQLAIATSQDPPKTSPLTPRRAAMVLLPVAVFLMSAWGLWNVWQPKPRVPVLSAREASLEMVASGEAAKANQNGTTLPVALKLARIIVGPGPNATCTTLAEAIQRAAQNGEITVSGPEFITESITIEGVGLNGLKLKASPRVTWRCPVEATAETYALLIRDVAGVELEGFDFEVANEKGRALHLLGQVGDIAITDCAFQHQLPTHKLSLVSIAAAQLTPESRVAIKHCRFKAASGNCFCVSIDAKERSSPRVECLDSTFESIDRHLLIAKSCAELRLTGNVFVGGHTGIHLHFKPWTGHEHFEITNNTFVGTQYWFSWMDSFPAPNAQTARGPSRVCNNLILGGERTLGDNKQWDAAISAWTFANNWWERDATTKPTANRGDRIAEIRDQVDVPVRVGQSHPEYLVPATASPLLTSGTGGDLPTHIGAKSRLNP